MKVQVFAGIVACALLGGCAEMATGLAAYSDQMAVESGSYWQDEHHSEPTGGRCPTLSEYGRVNNQTYYRVRNTGPQTATVTVTWNTGLTSNFTVGPGQTSNFVYMTPSVWPSGASIQC